MFLLSGLSTPMATASDGTNNSNSFLSSPSGSGSPPGIEVSDLMKSLQPATERRPQIPFPTKEALQSVTAATSSSSSSSATTATPNPFLLRKPASPVPQENLLKENPYSLPALISMESTTSRPYNGADVLVLQVWTENPSSSNAAATPKKSIGGAKIPISAVVGGFPVRVSLGPQNALSAAPATDEVKSRNDEQKVQEWKDYLSSESLWVRAAVCRGSQTSTAKISSYCPSEYPISVLEGIGFSKWIDLSSMVGSSSSSTSGADTATGLRAPVPLILAAPR